MLKLLRALFRCESGQDLAEYGIALAVIAIGTGLISVAIAGNVSRLWVRAQTGLASVTSAL